MVTCAFAVTGRSKTANAVLINRSAELVRVYWSGRIRIGLDHQGMLVAPGDTLRFTVDPTVDGISKV